MIATVAGASAATSALAQAPAPASKAVTNPSNPTGRTITLTLPAVMNTVYLGDVGVTLQPDGTAQFSPQRIEELLTPILIPAALDRLKTKFQGRPVASASDFNDTGVTIKYDPQALQLTIAVQNELQVPRNIAVGSVNPAIVGSFTEPARLSAYVNVRSNFSYVENGGNVGIQEPTFYLDGAIRSYGLALETEAVAQPGSSTGVDFQRVGSRVVYDDRTNLIRWTAGDLLPLGQGFQSAGDLAGISLFRSYSLLDPTQSIRPTGAQSFTLQRPSDVTITVNGTNVRRIHLNPGTYNLQDFPFTQGANNVTISIIDDTGAQQTLNFNVFLNQTQLASGLSEFGLFAGVESQLGASGPHYTDRPQVTGYIRHGFSEFLTAGANLQGDQDNQLFGLQALWATAIGNFGLDMAGSNVKDYGGGYAGTLTFQRLFQFVSGSGDSLNLAATYHSANFAPVGVTIPSNRYVYELSSSYAHAFDASFYTNLTAHYGHARDGFSDIDDYHVVMGYSPIQSIGLTFDTSYQQGGVNRGFGAMITLTWQASTTSSVRSDYNTFQNDARLSYYNVSGSGVGAYNITGDLERADYGSNFNGTVNYVANRAQLGLTHFSSFDPKFHNIESQTTSAQIATSLAYADGAVSIGRPINQAFAVVEAHDSLNGADVIVNPTPYNQTADSGFLGSAVDTDLSAYVPSTIMIAVPNAPVGYDIGAGAFRVNPPYRAGYRLVVGSDYSVTALGTLIGADGKPISLIAGKAIEIAEPDRPAITVFTNRQGRFGISGLRPGKWRIEMLTEPQTVFIITVPEGAKAAVNLGQTKPIDAEK